MISTLVLFSTVLAQISATTTAASSAEPASFTSATEVEDISTLPYCPDEDSDSSSSASANTTATAVPYQTTGAVHEATDGDVAAANGAPTAAAAGAVGLAAVAALFL